MRNNIHYRTSLTVLFMLFTLMVTGVTPMTLFAKSRFFIPWGPAEDALGLADRAQRNTLAFPGPSSLQVFNQNIYVLDAVNSSIKVFSKSGKLLKVKPLPKTAGNKPAVYPDFHVSDSGKVFVLERSSETVHILNRKLSAMKTVPVPKEQSVRSLSAISVIKNEIVVFDCFSGNLILFSPGSKTTRKLKGMYYADLIHDNDNLLYGARIKGGRNPEPGRISVFSLDLSSRKRKLAAVFSSKSEINSYSLAGVDSSGRIYLTLAFGGADETTSQWLLIFKKNGTLHRKLRLPIGSGELTMTRSKDVDADGTLVVVKPTEKGLKGSTVTVP